MIPLPLFYLEDCRVRPGVRDLRLGVQDVRIMLERIDVDIYRGSPCGIIILEFLFELVLLR